MSDADTKSWIGDLKRRRAEKQSYSTQLYQSEYNRLLLWCYNFCVAAIETSPWDKMGIMRRNRIFQFLCKIAEQRDELPTIEEYFGDRRIGIFDSTITTMYGLEYASMLQDKIASLNDWRIKTEPIED